MDYDKDLHKLGSAFIGTARFFFAEGALTAAAAGGALGGLQDFGNVLVTQLTRADERVNIHKATGGRKRITKRLPTMQALEYTLKTNEIDPRKLMVILGAAEQTPFTQSSLSAQDGDEFDYTAQDPSKGEEFWYDLKVSGVRVREISAVTVLTLTEGTDFVVEKKLGLIRFVTEQTVSRTPVITAPEITSSDDGYLRVFKALEKSVFKGFGRLIWEDEDPDNPLFLDHDGFSCELTFTDLNEFDGASEPEVSFNLLVTEEVGQHFQRA